MRAEEKEIDGFELEEAEERKRANELVEEDEEEVYDLDGKPEFERDQERTSVVLGAMHKILEREHIVIDSLELSKRELKALEALKTAVDGRDQEINGFVYAEDRRALLEQALAVLQPDLANLQQLGGKPFEDLMHEVGGLREKLNTLEDAQEELVEGRVQSIVEDTGDKDDKPKPDEDTSLTGPERKVEKPASSLTGPERKVEKPTSSLTGPERKVEKPTSSLTGPERKQAPKPASSLGGPEIEEAAKPPTTLGDPKEIEATAKKPWWKRLTGG